jgi:hypothetical protein
VHTSTSHKAQIGLYEIPSGMAGWSGYNELIIHRPTGAFKIQKHPLSMSCKYEKSLIKEPGDDLPCALEIPYNTKKAPQK